MDMYTMNKIINEQTTRALWAKADSMTPGREPTEADVPAVRAFLAALPDTIARSLTEIRIMPSGAILTSGEPARRGWGTSRTA